MVQIRCTKCKKEFDISKEQMKKIDETQIGQRTIQEYLDIFPSIGGRCGDIKDSRHAFTHTDKFTDEMKQMIQNYDNCNNNIAELKKELENISNTNIKLLQDKEKINKRLDEIRDTIFTNDQKTNSVSLEEIPNKEKELEQLLDKFEDITGTRNVDIRR